MKIDFDMASIPPSTADMLAWIAQEHGAGAPLMFAALRTALENRAPLELPDLGDELAGALQEAVIMAEVLTMRGYAAGAAFVGAIIERLEILAEMSGDARALSMVKVTRQIRALRGPTRH